MAQRSAEEVQKSSDWADVKKSAGKTAQLRLRNGVWYADNVRVNDYQKALKLTLRNAAIAPPPKATAPTRKPRKPKAEPAPERLEARLWWPEFVRDHLERKAHKAAADRYDALFKKRRDWEARRKPLWIAQAGALANQSDDGTRSKAAAG